MLTMDLLRCVLASLFEALSVSPLVGCSVGAAFVKYSEKWIFTTRRKEGRGRSNEEEGGARRKV